MSERPGAADLLEEARRTLLDILLPLLPQDRRYDGLMIANAISIASRECRLGDDDLREEVRRLAALLDVGSAADPSQALPVILRDLERNLVQELRCGAYDSLGPRRDTVRVYLRTSTEGRVRISNPRALAKRLENTSGE